MDDDMTIGQAVILIVIFIIWLPIWYHFANNPKEAAKALSTTNLINIKYTGTRFFGCSHEEFYRTGFMANTPNGQSISGVVCSGLLFKGSTIRYD